jgi:hypothetical protein
MLVEAAAVAASSSSSSSSFSSYKLPYKEEEDAAVGSLRGGAILNDKSAGFDSGSSIRFRVCFHSRGPFSFAFCRVVTARVWRFIRDRERNHCSGLKLLTLRHHAFVMVNSATMVAAGNKSTARLYKAFIWVGLSHADLCRYQTFLSKAIMVSAGRKKTPQAFTVGSTVVVTIYVLNM